MCGVSKGYFKMSYRIALSVSLKKKKSGMHCKSEVMNLHAGVKLSMWEMRVRVVCQWTTQPEEIDMWYL